MATRSSKCAKKNCFGTPYGPGSFLKNANFFCSGSTLLTHFGTRLFGLPLAAYRGPPGLGTGVWASVRAFLRGGPHQKWVVAGGIGSFEIEFWAT